MSARHRLEAGAADAATVHVVDGDAAVRDSLRSLLGSLGYRVETWGSAEDFLQRARFAPPTCLITEVHLPGMSGLRLQSELAERGLDLPIIVTASRGDVPMAVRALRAGAVDFLEKPFVDRVLTERIQEALRGRGAAPS